MRRGRILRCGGCGLPELLCLCVEVAAVHIRTRFVVVRHASEHGRPSNTGRLVPRAVGGALLLDYARQRGTFDDPALREPGTRLLFPGGDCAVPDPPPRTVVVIDSTWGQARRMAHRIPALVGMPTLSLPAPPEAFLRLRRAHRPDAMATLEAVARAVERLEGADAARPLLELCRELALRHRAALRAYGTPVRR